MSAAQQISAMRKAGQLDEALALARPLLAEIRTNTELKWAVGWLLYALVKRDVGDFVAGQRAGENLVSHLDEWLRQYTRSGKPNAPDLLHSLLMTQVLKVARDWPNFLAFARWWWNPSLLRPEDRTPFETDDGKTIDSLELRLIHAVARLISRDQGEQRPDLVAWGAELLDNALRSHPDDRWLHYFKSKFLTKQGDTEEARKHLLPFLRRQRRASWAWSLFGQTWEQDNTDRAIMCYFRALQVARKDVEVLKTRVRLAGLLAKSERYAEAAVQVRAAQQCREQHGYKIPQHLTQLMNSDWFQRYGNLQNISKEPDVAADAESLLFGADVSDVVHRLGVIDHQNLDKALAHVAFGADDGAILLYRMMQGISKLAVGTCVEVGFVEGEKRPISFRQSEKTTIPGVCDSFEGELSQRPGQAFAFIIADGGTRIYVHPELASKLSSGMVGKKVSSHAMISRDKQGRPGWRAISVEPLETSVQPASQGRY